LAISNKHHKTLNRAVGKAMHDYSMISEGDRLLVGISGGVDSLCLLWILKERQLRSPVDYHLQAIHVDHGFPNDPGDELKRFCDRLGVGLRVEHTDFGPLGHSAANQENPCFLCSRLRRKRLFECAAELDCNKVALGHHKDDIIETLLINMFYAGEISTMVPAQPCFNGKLTIIRPLAYSDQDSIREFAKMLDFPETENTCPSAGVSKRREVKLLLQQLYGSNDKIKGNLFRAMRHVKPEYLL
jgi:tRNA 2-thiocytidine biosynthesis protein TtcA